MLTIQQLHFGYRKGNRVLSGIDLHLEPGQIAGLLGYNGVGKTTLLHLVSGLLFPDTGQLEVMGYTPAKRQVDFLKALYYVPVESNLPDWHISRFVRLYSPFYPLFDYNYFQACLQRFEVPLEAHLRALSFGQRKKVQIAFALATRARLLLFDEPTDGLDIPSKRQFRQLLAEYPLEDSLILLSTHHIQDVTTLLDRLIILNNQELLLEIDTPALSRSISMQTTKFAPDDALYSEPILGGYQNLFPGDGTNESNVDLEFFMRALYDKKETLLPCLTPQLQGL